MRAVLSLAAPRSSINDCNEVLQSGTCKKNKSSCLNEDNSRLIPCLPDELSLQILARLPRIHYFNLRLVSQKWKATEKWCITQDKWINGANGEARARSAGKKPLLLKLHKGVSKVVSFVKP
ncbi:hypothetical protein PVK06_002940 [Gossypium arboreum]|uniref:F-box domain-containing protein n=1 Tax=Gossypium arboreum TaxID=29729 RepID=A0ABR0R559_GOSAR|nr:hypothetical protein PVK06_002940 [Gossypium arboreum]